MSSPTMGFKVVFIILLYLDYLSGLNTVLNVEELNSVHYNVDILSKPVLKGKAWDKDVMTMVNKHGQEYVCELPEVSSSKSDSKKDENLLDQLTDISELLKPMKDDPCLVKTKDWWTYEFCYGSVIKQYRLENNKATGPILILGKYDTEYNWKNNSETKNKLQRFHSQFYVNGTKCDLTGEPRRAEVRFYCEDGVGDLIQRVDEPESCRYVVTVSTKKVCDHPYLQPQTLAKPHMISCHPALSHNQLEQYNKLQEIKAEEEAKQALEVNENSEGETKLSDDEDEDLKLKIQFLTVPVNSKKNLYKNLDEKTTEKDEESEETLLNKLSKLNPELKEKLLDDEMKIKFLDYPPDSQKDAPDILNEETTEQEVPDELGSDNPTDLDIDNLLKKLNEGNDKTDKLGNILFTITDEMLDELESSLTPKIFGQSSKPPDETLEELRGMWKVLTAHYDKYSTLWKALAEEYSDSNILAEISAMEKKAKKITERFEDEEEEKHLKNRFMQSELLEYCLYMKKTIHMIVKHIGLNPLPTYKIPNLSGEKNTLPDIQKDNIDLEESSEPLTNPPSSFSDTNDPTQDAAETDIKSEKIDTKNTKHLHILNEKTMDEHHKSKLEISIREKLQKSGLDNKGRKIEVKILTPNHLDDDDGTMNFPLLALSKEETEAVQNIIVNILSKNTEEFDEREKHESLVKNYNFQIPKLEDHVTRPHEEGDIKEEEEGD